MIVIMCQRITKTSKGDSYRATFFHLQYYECIIENVNINIIKYHQYYSWALCSQGYDNWDIMGAVWQWSQKKSRGCKACCRKIWFNLCSAAEAVWWSRSWQQCRVLECRRYVSYLCRTSAYKRRTCERNNKYGINSNLSDCCPTKVRS